MFRYPRYLRLLAPSWLLLGACSTSSVTGTTFTPVTAIVVDPAQFLGGVACIDAPGAMRSYVATLYEVASTRAGLVRTRALPSSAPTACFRQVQFQGVRVGAQYVADVDGYDRDDIVPLEPGSRTVVASGSRTKTVPPRWTTSCGTGPSVIGDAGRPGSAKDGGAEASGSARRGIDAGTPAPAEALDAACPAQFVTVAPPSGWTPPLNGPVCAQAQASLIIQGCAPLQETGVPSVTGVMVDLFNGALPGGSCTTALGEIATFSVSLRGAPGPSKEASCGGSAELDGLVDGTSYVLDVMATAMGEAGTETLTTSCFATAIGGVVVPAACDPLSDAAPRDD